VVDARRHPVSVRFPHFTEAPLRAALTPLGIAYHQAGRQLGGLRTPLPNSRHVALIQDGLRGFADYMDMTCPAIFGPVDS
jgi:hypothetical protein